MSVSRGIERALELESRYPAAAEMLRYYRGHPLAPSVCSVHVPLVAVLREEGRSLLCAHCLEEQPFRRMVCAFCGEEDHHKLPVFNAEEFPHIRIEACDTCGRYLKAIDLTRDGRAVPEVDDIASIALDLWAMEQGYARVEPNPLTEISRV